MRRSLRRSLLTSPVLLALVAGSLYLTPLPAHGAGVYAEAKPSHQITSGQPRVARAYADALRAYHQGQLPEAIAGFQEALRRDPNCAMAAWGLSRAQRKAGNAAEARKAEDRALTGVDRIDAREKAFVQAWDGVLKAEALPEAGRKTALDGIRNDLDLAIALYPDDPELWLLRGDLAGSPLRATPFYLAALRLDPTHPFGQNWKPAPPPAPEVQPTVTKPVGPVKETPRLFEGLGQLHQAINTGNTQAQAFYDQGLRCFHAYVMPDSVKNSSAACFQYAANQDQNCAMAYWGLSFGRTSAMTPKDAANHALELALKNGNDRERRFCAARVLELGGPTQREAFLDALDGAIAAYPEEVELWIWRGKVWGEYGYSTGTLQGIPYFLAANRMHPEHPAPNHELIHAYEGIERPALGWPYTWGFRRAAPNMPHANHMQAHLAMRLGRWQEAIDGTRLSRRRSLEGYPELSPDHHIDVLVRALAHEGRFTEAEAEPRAYRDGLPWARLLRLKADPAALDEWAARRRAANASDGYYIGALAAFDRGDIGAAVPCIERVLTDYAKNKDANYYRRAEVVGRQQAMSGKTDEGLKLLREAAARAVKDADLHAWGGGSYMLEIWGETALQAHRWDDAEEAFHEALAHEHGSVIGALGMQVVWEQRGDSDMARHYAERAATIWRAADAGSLDRQLARLRHLAGGPTPAVFPTTSPTRAAHR